MSSSCLSSGGGGRAYRLEALDLEIIKSPSSTSWVSNSSSPSSTLSESSNCPRAISTRKPRTPRKRPNQTYNEAAAILSTAYPKIFPATKPSKFPNSHDSYSSAFLFEPSELLMPFQQVDTLRLLLDLDFQKPVDIKGLSPFEKPCRSPPELSNSPECQDEFDAESILDEEIGGGIESIMGNLEMGKENAPINNTFCYGYPVGLGYGLRRESRAMRNDDEWWKFPRVNVVDANPNVVCNESKKNKVEIKKVEETEDSVPPQPNAGQFLNLNYDGILHAWSDKPSPFTGEVNDVRVCFG